MIYEVTERIRARINSITRRQPLTKRQEQTIDALNGGAKRLMLDIAGQCPPGREQMLALNYAELALIYAREGITRHGSTSESEAMSDAVGGHQNV